MNFKTNPEDNRALIPPLPADVDSIGSIVTALYDSISFGPGQARTWERLKSLFLPGARLIKVSANLPVHEQVLDVNTFVERSEEYLKDSEFEVKGFLEREVAGHCDQFGDIAHVLSTYESCFATDPDFPIARGINSIQLMKHSGRWWAVTIFWDVEMPERPIPPKYL